MTKAIRWFKYSTSKKYAKKDFEKDFDNLMDNLVFCKIMKIMQTFKISNFWQMIKEDII